MHNRAIEWFEKDRWDIKTELIKSNIEIFSQDQNSDV